MYIEKIKIRNFGNLESVDTTFSKLNLIMGDNGSGKSKFLSTIIYSLCDYLDEKISDYVRTGTSKFEIDTLFNHVGQSYRLQIEGSTKGSEKLLTVNGKDTFKNSAAVEYIEKYIHNPKLTLASSITMQGKGSDILFEPNQKRVERLKQIFNIDKLNAVGLYLKEQVDEIKNSYKSLEIENNVLHNTVYDYKKEIDLPDENKLIELRTRKLELESIRSECLLNKALYDQYIKDLKIYEDAQSSIESIRKILNDNQNEVSVLQKGIFRVDENQLIENSNKKNEINSQLTELTRQLLVIKKYTEINAQIKKLQDKQNKIEFKRQPRKVEIDEALKQKLIDSATDVNVLESRRDLVCQGKCPTCGQDYKEYGSIDDFNKLLTELQNKKDEIENTFRQQERELKEYNDIKQFNEKSELEKSLLQDQIDQCNDDLKLYNISEFDVEKNIHEKIKFLDETYIILDKEWNDLNDTIKTNKGIEDKIKDLCYKIEFGIKESERFQTVKEPDQVQALVEFNDTEYNSVIKDLSEYDKQKNDYETIISYNKMLKELYITNNEKIDKNQKELDKLRNQSKVKDMTKKIITSDFASWLISNGSEFIKKKMNEFFSRSYGKFSLDLRTEEKSVDFYYSENGTDFLNVALASGFEKECLSLAFRIALCSLGNLGLNVYDEIDSFSSAENSLRLYETLLKEDYQQLHIISHYPDTQEFLINNGCNVIQL